MFTGVDGKLKGMQQIEWMRLPGAERERGGGEQMWIRTALGSSAVAPAASRMRTRGRHPFWAASHRGVTPSWTSNATGT